MALPCALMHATTHLLYLHGFRSSPQSTKAQKMAARVARDHPSVVWWCPQLPPSPRAAMQMVLEGVANWPRQSMAVVGSSLGGFYATHVATLAHCPSVLLNPAVFPARDLARYIGEQSSWHDPRERFFFEPAFVQELKNLEVEPAPQSTPTLAIIAKGDEVLDWREMHARYAYAQIVLLEGSDHAISDFDAHMNTVFGFLQLL